MTNQPVRRRRPAAVVKDVFDGMKEQMDSDCDDVTGDLTNWGDSFLIRSNPVDGPQQLIGPVIASEIVTTLNWTEAFVEGLTFVDGHTAPSGHVPLTRKRLRHLLNMLNHFMGKHPELQSLTIRDDIATLGIALDALVNGIRHPLLASQAMNKPADTKLDQLFRCYIVALVTVLITAGYSRPQAYKEVASQLTLAGFTASRPTPADPSINFRVETVRRYFQRAQPQAEDLAAIRYKTRHLRPKDQSYDRKTTLGQHDSHLVGKMLDSFVMNAVNVDNETMPPSKNYAIKVVRATLHHPSFQALFSYK